LFSFDLPREIVRTYEENGLLTPQGAVALKQEMFHRIEIFDTRYEVPRLFRLEADREWLAALAGRPARA